MGDLPKIGAPATRALAAHGITALADCATVTAAEALSWHGVGPRAVRILDESLQEAGLGWSPPTTTEA